MNKDCKSNWPDYPDEVPKIEITSAMDNTMQVEINGNPDMGIVLQQGYVGHWVSYDYPPGKTSTINRIEVLGTKKINHEECYEVEYVSAEPGKDFGPPSHWYYTKRADKIYWVRFTYERDGETIIEDIDDTCPFPMEIEPRMSWHGQDTQTNAETGEIYVSRIRSTKVEAVAKLRIGNHVHRCLKLVMISTNADGTGAPTLIEKYIDESGRTILRRKYMSEDNVGDRKQLRQSLWIEHDNMRYYLWYDSVFL